MISWIWPYLNARGVALGNIFPDRTWWWTSMQLHDVLLYILHLQGHFGMYIIYIYIFVYNTLPETNSSPLKIGLPKRKVVFQPSIFRCYVSFREGIYSLIIVSRSHLDPKKPFERRKNPLPESHCGWFPEKKFKHRPLSTSMHLDIKPNRSPNTSGI